MKVCQKLLHQLHYRLFLPCLRGSIPKGEERELEYRVLAHPPKIEIVYNYLFCKGFFNTGSFLFGTSMTDISILFNNIEEG